MRSPERIKPFLDEFGEIWAKEFPDQRFGQLCSNFFGWMAQRNRDLFFPEEDEMIRLFREFADRGENYED